MLTCNKLIRWGLLLICHSFCLGESLAEREYLEIVDNPSDYKNKFGIYLFKNQNPYPSAKYKLKAKYVKYISHCDKEMERYVSYFKLYQSNRDEFDLDIFEGDINILIHYWYTEAAKGGDFYCFVNKKEKVIVQSMLGF